MLTPLYADPQRILMQPRKLLALDEDIRTVLAKALITQFSPLTGRKIPTFTAKRYVPTVAIRQWGQVRIAEGGTQCAVVG